jgi:hypothetical protein
MVAQQKNMSLFTYVDGTGQSWNKRGELDAIRNAVDGSAAAGAHPGWGRETRRHSVRKIIYVDLTTQRTKTVVFYTAAAFAAITLGTSTLSFMVEGETVAIVYTASKGIPERLPKATAGGNLADHA